jgi:hypothetical protein
MWNEITPSGKQVYQPSSPEEARGWMERTLPALLIQTTYEVKRFWDAVAKANLMFSPHHSVVKIPVGAADTFRRTIAAIETVRQEEVVMRGGVFIPYEGSPWNGFRLANSLPFDLNRDLVSDNHIFEQMLDASLALSRNLRSTIGEGGTMLCLASRRDVQSLFSIYGCPAAATWIPPTGFRYREVRNALVEAAGGPAHEISTHVMQSISLIPESRIMPRLSELMQDGDLKTVSRRVATNTALAEAQQSFELAVVAPTTKPASKSSTPVSARPAERELQPSLLF